MLLANKEQIGKYKGLTTYFLSDFPASTKCLLRYLLKGNYDLTPYQLRMNHILSATQLRSIIRPLGKPKTNHQKLKTNMRQLIHFIRARPQPKREPHRCKEGNSAFYERFTLPSLRKTSAKFAVKGKSTQTP